MLEENLEENPLSFSIVIPSYNCASWLERAVASAYALTSAEIEVIIVDDGSTDDTPEVCAALKRRHAGLKIVRQPNGGLSAARNAGIRVARGAFIVLLDADDELLPFDATALAGSQADVVRIAVEEVPVEGESRYWREPDSGTQSGTAYLQRHLTNGTLYIPSWAYIYRRSFLEKNELSFTPALIHEDMLFTIQALLKADSVTVIDQLVYRYFRRAGSITLQKNLAASRRRLNSLQRILKEILEMANRQAKVDLWRWAERVTDYAWSFALETHSRRLACRAFQLEMMLITGYTGWGLHRSRRDVLWRVRRGLKRVLQPRWTD